MVTEEQVMIKAMPYLEDICRGHWCNLEFEDRLAEAQLVFLSSVRKFSNHSGHFMPDFQAVLKPYMDELNRKTPSLHFGLSLDADMRTKTGAAHCNAHCFLTARDQSESQLYVKLFIESLIEPDRDLVCALLSGDSKAEIAREHHMSVKQLKTHLEEIGQRYLEEYGRN